MDKIAVCRRVEDQTMFDLLQGTCCKCGKPVYIEDTVEGKTYCIYCAAEDHPTVSVFVELPPDEFGRRSEAKSIAAVNASR